MRRIFVDTEFTNLDEATCELISIGLVEESGRELYLELSDWDRSKASVFVVQVVLPLLGKDVEACTASEAAGRVRRWLADAGGPREVISDSPHDIRLLKALVGEMPQTSCRVIEADISEEVHDRVAISFKRGGQPRHHALVDARVLRQAYFEVIGRIGCPGQIGE